LRGQQDPGPPVLGQSTLEQPGAETVCVLQAEPPLSAEWPSRSCASAEAQSTRPTEHNSLTSLLQLQHSSHPPPPTPPPPEPVTLQPDRRPRQVVLTAQHHGPLSWQTSQTTHQPAAIPPRLSPHPHWSADQPHLPPQRHWSTHAAATGSASQNNPSGGPLSRAYQDKHGFAGRSVARLRDQVATAAVPHQASGGPHLHAQYGLSMSVGGSLRADAVQFNSVPLGRHAPNYGGTGAGMPSRRQPAPVVPHQMVRLISRTY
jgi:hypothetical protein